MSRLGVFFSRGETPEGNPFSVDLSGSSGENQVVFQPRLSQPTRAGRGLLHGEPLCILLGLTVPLPITDALNEETQLAGQGKRSNEGGQHAKATLSSCQSCLNL